MNYNEDEEIKKRAKNYIDFIKESNSRLEKEIEERKERLKQQNNEIEKAKKMLKINKIFLITFTTISILMIGFIVFCRLLN